MNSSRIPVIEADLADWVFNQDPFPVIERWRELGPVVYNAHNDVYLTFSYRDCARVIGHLEQFDSSVAAQRLRQSFGGTTMQSIDTPRHHQMRGVWAQDFQREELEARRRQLITEVIDARLDPFIERLRSGETVDAVSGLTRGIPTLVIANMLGIETERHDEFSAWSDAIGGFSEARLDTSPRGQRLVEEGVAATTALNDYLRGIVERRRRVGRDDDLVSRMVFHDFADEMDEQEIVASITQLVFAGNETTAKLMASTMVALGQFPQQRRLLVDDRSLIPAAIEEMMRWMTVVTNLQARHACSPDSNIQGIPIPMGAAMAPLIAAANRDPARWDDPHAFDIRRPPRQHLGFGFGMHVCLGLNLARLEAQIWLNRLLDRLPEWHLAGPVDYGRNFMIRGPLAVPVSA
jgi:cytochrome P450